MYSFVQFHKKGALFLASNSLTGPIPSEMGSCVQLKQLDLSNNRFTGTLPVELEGLANLHNLNIQFTDLEAPVPSGICDKDVPPLDLPSVQVEEQRLERDFKSCSCCVEA